jgi:DNA-binding NarL/FixJ family response regulator
VLIDIELAEESGFDLATSLAELDHKAPPISILISIHSEADFAELIETSPAAGFLSKGDLSAQAVRSIVGESAGR